MEENDDVDDDVHMEPHVAFAADPEDDGILTQGILTILARFCLARKGMKCEICSVSLNVTSPLAHIGQKDSYSCGYRNIQMLLSSLLHLLPDDHVLFPIMNIPPLHRRSLTVTLPTIFHIQQALESAWAQGYDPEGARHYCHQICGTTARIGAMEVASLLEYLHLDCVVVQFIQCEASRAQLAPFLWNYFSSFKDLPSAMSRVLAALNDGTEWGNNSSKPQETSSSPSQYNIFPVYLQWQGHSITVVGVERCLQTNNLYKYSLLVLNPSLRFSSAQSRVPTSLPFPFPLENLRGRDVQIIIVTALEGDPVIIGTHKTCRVVTAQEDLVMTALCRSRR